MFCPKRHLVALLDKVEQLACFPQVSSLCADHLVMDQCRHDSRAWNWTGNGSKLRIVEAVAEFTDAYRAFKHHRVDKVKPPHWANCS